MNDKVNITPVDLVVAAAMLRSAKAQLVKQTEAVKATAAALHHAEELERDLQTQVKYAEQRLLISI